LKGQRLNPEERQLFGRSPPFLFVILLLILGQPALSRPAVDPATGLVRALYIGDCYGKTPFYYLQEEPMFQVTPIPASLHESRFTWEEMKRSLRRYMPRTYREHAGKYDLVLLSDTGFGLFSPAQLMWFKRGVVEGGQGILMVGGYQSFGGKAPEPSWGGSSVEDVLPVSCLDGQVWETGSFIPVPVDQQAGFSSALPWKGVKPFLGMNIVKTKETAVEILSPSSGPKGPLLVYWEVGNGSGLANTPDLTPGWGREFMLWEFYPDYVSDLLYLLARLRVPQDVGMMHSVRTALLEYREERSLLLSLADFMGKFGATTAPIERRLAELDGMKAEADHLYTEQDYEAVLSKMDELSASLKELGREAVRLKERALMWVFLSEWFAVSATLMICGYILWSLMIRRRLYREAGMTRLV